MIYKSITFYLALINVNDCMVEYIYRIKIFIYKVLRQFHNSTILRIEKLIFHTPCISGWKSWFFVNIQFVLRLVEQARPRKAFFCSVHSALATNGLSISYWDLRLSRPVLGIYNNRRRHDSNALANLNIK